MATFIEAPIFSKYVHDYLSDEEYADFQLYLAANPDLGISFKDPAVFARYVGSEEGAARVVGVRVMYFARTAAGEIWLLLIYAKSVTDSIPGHILKALKEEMEHVPR